jgi:poly(U)-specific endoribonuclease
MKDIYQQIWNADQAESGIVPILDTATGDPTVGFVKVNSNLGATDGELQVLPEVVLPDSKKRTYDLCRALFDNYALAEKDLEAETPEEREEIHDMVHAMVDTAPMLVAREYVAEATGTSLTRERWYNTIMDMWFRRFSMGGDPDLSGFEHVVVGEQEGPKAQGYHFWYKYYLDDGFARLVDPDSTSFPGLANDRIVYLGSRQSAEQSQFPESVTISYRWNAPDYERQAMRPLTKKIGGFFVGCSLEGLLALGSVRAHLGARAPKEAVINGGRYSLKMFRSDNNRHIRTFYPVFLDHAKQDDNGGNGDLPVATDQVRIIAALINPKGDDPGYETVTLINKGTMSQPLNAWTLIDKNGKSQPLANINIGAGETVRINLDPSGLQLSNKGGTIKLINAKQQVVHTVIYSKGQAGTNGETLIF